MGNKETQTNINNFKWQICYQKPLFDASKIKNFALWNSELSYLSEVRNPVDLLIIQYHAFYRSISNNDLFYDGASLDSSPVDSITSNIDNHSSRPISAFTKDKFIGKNGSSDALLNRLDNSKYNQSNLERMDSSSIPFSGNNNYVNSPSNVNNISLCVDTEELYGSERIVVDIDIDEFMRSFSGEITTLTVGKYITKRIKKVIEMCSINWVWGFYFSNLQNLIDKYGMDDCQQFLLYFRKTFPYFAIFTDITKMNVFEDLRDLIHGIIIYNVVFHPDGRQKSRWEWDNMKFQDYIAALRNEISLRTDFVVLDVEVLPLEKNQTFNHYQKRRYYRKWVEGNSFKGWISFNSNFNSIKCVSPPEFSSVNSFDIYEMCSSSDVQTCRQMIMNILPQLNWKDKLLNRNVWSKVLREANIPVEIINRISSIYDVTQIELSDVLLIQPPKPEFPPIEDVIHESVYNPTSNQKSLMSPRNNGGEVVLSKSNNETENAFSEVDADADTGIGYVDPSILWKQPNQTHRVFSTTAIGKTYGNERRKQVEIKLIDIMINLLEKNLLKSINPSIPSSSTQDISKSLVNQNNDISLSYDEFEFQPEMEEIIQFIDDITNQPSPLVIRILNEVFGGYDISLTYFKELRDHLMSNQVSIYIGTNSSFILKESPEELPYKKVWAIMGLDDNDKLYIFVPENVPNIVELVINCYFRRYFYHDSGKCLLLESLVVAQSQPDCLPISRRVRYEIENSTYSELFYFIRNTYLIQSSLESKIQNPVEKELLVAYASYVSDYAHYLLVEKFDYFSKIKEQVKKGYIPVHESEKEMYEWVAYCTLDPQGDKLIKEFNRKIETSMRENNYRTDSSEALALSYLFMLFWKACRRVAWIEMESSLINMNPSFIPDYDQVAVGMEMITTQSNLNMMFDLNSHQLAKYMHPVLRNNVKESREIKENIISENMDKGTDTKKARQLANAFLFVYPVIIDLILVRCLGSGIFINAYMDNTAKDVLNFVFMFIFPVCGGLMNSIARTCTFYYFYKSFSLMIAAFLRRYSASLIVLSITSVLIGIGSLFRTGYDVVYMVLFIIYTFFFGHYLVLFAILGSIKDINIWLFKNKGPSIALLGSAILLIPNLFCYFMFKDKAIVDSHYYSKIILGIYDFGFMVANLVMLLGYRRLSRNYLKFASKIKIPTKDEILDFYAIDNPKPEVFAEESPKNYLKRVALWERSARIYYMSKVNKARKNVAKKGLKSGHSIIQERIRQQRWENELMGWYVQRSGKPAPLKFSNEWDTMLKCALEELKKKNQVEKINRGDLLFDFERVVIYFGVFYFIYIFIDKWSLFILEGKPYLFLPENLKSRTDIPFKEYLNGSLYATLFMLICSGFLELTLSHVLMSKNKEKNSRLGWFTAKEIINQYKADNIYTYKSELIKFLLVIVVMLIAMSGIIFLIHGYQRSVFETFGIVAFGFVGFLIGLYHKLFFYSRECEVRLNKFLIAIIVICVGVSAILKFYVGTVFYSFYSTCIGGWLFCIVTVLIYYGGFNSDVHYSVNLSPHLASSGQRFIGQKNDLLARENLEIYLRKVFYNKNFITPSEILLKSVYAKILDAKDRFRVLSSRNILKICFPDADDLLQDIYECFYNGGIKVKIAPEEIFNIRGRRYCAISSKNKTKDILDIYTFLPQIASSDYTMSDQIDPKIIEWVAAAVIHEYAEQNAGYSHAEAAILELLVKDGENLSELPIRYLYQICVSDKRELKKLIYGYVELEKKKTLLDIDIDCEWEKLQRNTKLFLIQLNTIWYKYINRISKKYNIESISINGKIPSDLTKLLNKKHNSSMKINQIIAFSVLSIYVARRVSDLCLNEQLPKEIMLSRKRSLKKQTSSKEFLSFNRRYSISRSISRKLSMKEKKNKGSESSVNQINAISNSRNKFIEGLEELEFIIYLAFTGDTRFGREFSTTNHFYLTRLILSMIFKISSKIRWILTKKFYLSEKNIKNLLVRMKKGSFRDLYYNKEKQIERIDSYNTSLSNVVSIVEGNREGYLLAKRYFQNKATADWKPTAKDKPFSIGFFNRKTRQLIKEHELGEGNKVKSTTYYEYTNERQMFPRKIYKLRGEISSANYRDFVQIANSPELYEEQYLTSNELSLITMSVLHVLNSSNEPIDIQVTYTYDHENTTLSYAQHSFTTYKCMSEMWVMVVYYAEKWRNDDFDKAIPPKLKEVHFCRLFEPQNEYVTEYDYSHPQHVKSKTVLLSKDNKFNPISVPTPKEIADDPYALLSRRPPPSFYCTNELLTYRLKESKSFRLFSKTGKTSYFAEPFSTARSRQELWSFWRAGNIAGVFARDIDEAILRKEKTLKSYWKHRDMGYRNKAREDLQKEKEALDIILVVNDIPTIRSNLHLRFSDLAILATGGDATEISSSKDLVVQKARSDADNHSISYFSTISHSRSKINRPNVSILSINPNRPHTIHINDDNSNSNSNSSSNDDILDVVNLDSGTWPTGGGGVGSCRRDLIDYLDRIRWTAIVEIGGAELVQRDYQIERNITSIRYLPLWDNDFSSPNENVYRDHDYLSLRRKTQATKDSVIQSIFLPMVKLLIQGMVETKFTEDNLDRYEKLFIDFYLYFQKCDWSISWNHKKTQICWLKTWLEYCEKELGKGNSLSVEMPTISDIDMLFSLTTRLLLPITAEIPNISVFHASHHGVQAIIGVVAKALYKSRLIIWDHGILWRERLFGLCYSDTMPRFIQNGFVGLTRLISWLVFSKADYITPCTSIQNVTWEEWLGGKKYNNQRKMIETREKIYPIVNGMNVAKFNPQPERENPTPLAIMLSHISSVKDIHNAIYAANIIVNQMNIRSYKLHIYGSLQKDPNYTSETLNLISSLNLTEHVILKGLGNPSNVLPTGWVFVNSSITEGLPLAIGEAGLCGLPVVCTDVGGSREVVSDLKNNIVYGCIVPPQKPNQLAHAQLRVLCMTDGLKQVVNKKSKDTLTIEELIKKGASAVEARMNDPSIKEQRHELGLLMRKRTIEMFSITRYWRQHEQLLWLGHLSNKREKYMNMFS
ncbi:hypothetical protein LY90DRAFT_233293 [Neocallimastix californiae]|jgi:glycosyltransferase involved in cell wall biosynthesis|uniref:DUF3492 domain-containing protein n=1 Tax=Neocallimastix californiae TaxID=1754190 RepID=A0A1Y1YL62_9FUNG|nr:hypothetical protein LY90DRAFT_233293 [Neocallimastix californiae]|eukprot:ORX98735.1 hypothetical protein LY90DRAFT_233293 [Neocallimastix californiae]